MCNWMQNEAKKHEKKLNFIILFRPIFFLPLLPLFASQAQTFIGLWEYIHKKKKKKMREKSCQFNDKRNKRKQKQTIEVNGKKAAAPTKRAYKRMNKKCF